MQFDAQFQRDFSRMKESLERLTSNRGDSDRSQSAIRRGELAPIASIDLKSAQVTAAPTQADFNALQADVRNIHDALVKISNILGTATISKT